MQTAGGYPFARLAIVDSTGLSILTQNQRLLGPSSDGRSNTEPDRALGAGALVCDATMVNQSIDCEAEICRFVVDAKTKHARLTKCKSDCLSNTDQISVWVDDRKFSHAPGFVFKVVHARDAGLGKVGLCECLVNAIDVLYANVTTR